MALFPIAFLAGLIAGISPCILPVLPVVFVAWTTPLDDGEVTATHSRRRAFSVVAGLVLSFTVIILFGTTILDALGLPDDLLRNVGIGLIVLLGIGLIIPSFGAWLERPFARFAVASPQKTRSGFVLGLALGAVFVPCAGPILTAITVLGAHHRVGLSAVVLTLCFALGATIPLMFIALAGERVVERNRKLAQRARTWRPAAGVALVAMAILVMTNALSGLQTWLPGYTSTLQKGIEQNAYVARQLHQLQYGATAGAIADCSSGAPILEKCGAAPAFSGITHWLQTPGGATVSLSSLRGHVVLIDFWTYSCINCERTLPHVEAWYQRYHAAGFDVIGVHSPEFPFEHSVGNIQTAAHDLGVTYPIAVDNNLDTWSAYQNEYWPAEYLVDANGIVRHAEFGEGNYGLSEKLIRQLLVAARPHVVLPPSTAVPDLTPTSPLSPETYVGYERAQYTQNSLVPDRKTTYSLPSPVASESLGLGGEWTVHSWSATAGAHAVLALNYVANDVYLVLGGHGSVIVTTPDGARKVIAVSGYPRLYTLLSSTSESAGVMTMTFSPGVQAYDFTFG